MYESLSTVSFHNFKSQMFKLSVSNPKNKYVAYLSVLSQSSNCQGLGRKNKFEILKTYRIIRQYIILYCSILSRAGVRPRWTAYEYQSRFRCTCTWIWFRWEHLLKHLLEQHLLRPFSYSRFREFQSRAWTNLMHAYTLYARTYVCPCCARSPHLRKHCWADPISLVLILNTPSDSNCIRNWLILTL